MKPHVLKIGVAFRAGMAILTILAGASGGACSGPGTNIDGGAALRVSQSSPPLFRVTTPSKDQIASGGLEMSISQGTQFNDDPLHIGFGDANDGVYYDEDVRMERDGPHADLTIVVDSKRRSKPVLVRQVSAREGQAIDAGVYRILVEKVFPAGLERSGVILRIWRRDAGLGHGDTDIAPDLSFNEPGK